ncbi:MAG TPA: S8 family serine peptidase [Candidatus Dojkabacteria bacterium]|nr:S8 family serine peptidase [Candidatus Dojkabacteria bacterium]
MVVGVPSSKVVASNNVQSYVVTFKDGTSVDAMNTVLQQYGLQSQTVLDDASITVVKTTDDSAVSQLRLDTQVDSVVVEGGFSLDSFDTFHVPTPLVVTDPIYTTYQWGIRALYSDQAWNLGYKSSHRTVVGIIDTGVARNHSDLGPNIVYEKCFTSFQTTCNPYPQIPSSMSGNHGTLMAGVLGAVINDTGAVGVAPEVGIANYNVSEYGSEGTPTVYDSSMWAAISDAAKQHFDAVSLSEGEVLSLPLSADDQAKVDSWQRVIDKATKKGVVVVASAGNYGLNLDDPSIMVIPCELKNVMCVGATNIRPQPVFPQTGAVQAATFYTDYGTSVDFTTPGGDCGGPDFATCLTAPDPRYFIWSTNVVINATCGLTENCPVSYSASIGTSFSAPEAAGVAALVMDAYKQTHHHDLKPKDVLKILVKTADPLPATPNLGAGSLNAKEAVKEAIKHHEH